MVNLYRLCIAILFASLSSAIAQMCSVDSCEESTGFSCVNKNNSIYSKSIVKDTLSVDQVAQQYVDNSNGYYYKYSIYDQGGTPYVQYWSRSGVTQGSPIYPKEVEVQKEVLFCSIDLKPDLTDWENCKSGKDHGSSKIIVGDGSDGLPPTIVREDWWACDDPDIWITYRHPPQDGSIDPTDPEKPTDPKDPEKPEEGGEGGEGGDNGSGNGNNGGSDGGNDNGSNNGGDQNGTGLNKGEIQEAVEGALDSKGKELEGNINKWWLITQSEMNQEGTRMGHESDSMLDDAFSGMIVKRDINDFEREYRFQINAPKACPAPMVIEFIGFQATVPFDLICQFSEMIGYLVLASAYMSAIYIIIGLRRA